RGLLVFCSSGRRHTRSKRDWSSDVCSPELAVVEIPVDFDEGRAGKMAQAVVHGATLIEIDGNFDDGLRIVRELAENYPVELVNSVNPYRLQGQKTAAFEIVDVLGDAPDIHVLPVGNAGNISADWMGHRESHGEGAATKLPKMWGVQADGASPMVNGDV